MGNPESSAIGLLRRRRQFYWPKISERQHKIIDHLDSSIPSIIININQKPKQHRHNKNPESGHWDIYLWAGRTTQR
jgi:hypothetical protein